MQWTLEFPEESDDNSIPWNIDGLEFPQDTDDDSIPWNFGTLEQIENLSDNQVESQTGVTTNPVEEPPLKQIRLQDPEVFEGNPDDVEMPPDDNEASDTDSHLGVLVDDGEQPGTSRQVANEDRTVDSHPGVLVNDDAQPGTSREAENQNGNEYSNDNFSIDVKRIGFKKHTKFNFSDGLYHVQLKSKPGQSNVLFKDVLEGFLHSLTKILQDVKSKLKRGTDRMLYLVSQMISELLQ